MSAVALPPELRLLVSPEAAAMQSVYRLRVRAWRARNAIFPTIEQWCDDEDDHCLHWCVVDRGSAVVAAARLSVHERLADVPDAEIYPPSLHARIGPFDSINRLVVDPTYAGRGLSAVLDQVRIVEARRRGCRQIVAATSGGRQRLLALQRLGFEMVGDGRPYSAGPLAAVSGHMVLILNLA